MRNTAFVCYNRSSNETSFFSTVDTCNKSNGGLFCSICSDLQVSVEPKKTRVMIQSEIPDTCQLALLIIYHTGNICNITDSFIWRLKIATRYKLIIAIVIHLNNVFFKSNSKTIQFYYLKFMCFHEKSLSSIFDDLLLCCTQFSVPSKHSLISHQIGF